MNPQSTVLFICSGNFYRSRYAEALFNHAASRHLPDWRAESRGFKPHLAKEPLAFQVRERLENAGIPAKHTRETPKKLERNDLCSATRIIAMLEREHRPMMRKDYPLFEERAVYWQIFDIDVTPAEVALPQVERNVYELVSKLREGFALSTDQLTVSEF